MGKQNWRKLFKSSELIRQVKLLIIHKSSVSILFYSNGCKVTVFKAISLHYDLYKKKPRAEVKAQVRVAVGAYLSLFLWLVVSRFSATLKFLIVFMNFCFQIQCCVLLENGIPTADIVMRLSLSSTRFSRHTLQRRSSNSPTSSPPWRHLFRTQVPSLLVNFHA